MTELTLAQLNLTLLYVSGAFLLAAWMAQRGPFWEYDHLRFSEMLACVIWPLYILTFLLGLIAAALKHWLGGRR
jgi:hypothetical protein